MRKLALTLGLEMTAEERQETRQKLTNNLEALRLCRQACGYLEEGNVFIREEV